jgi:hypothetical protein
LIYCLPRSRQDERSLHQNWQGPKCCLCLSPSMYCNAYTQQKMWTMTTLSSVFLKHDNWNPPLTMTAQGIALTLAVQVQQKMLQVPIFIGKTSSTGRRMAP